MVPQSRPAPAASRATQSPLREGATRKVWAVAAGSAEGVFRTQRDAVRFALSEGGSIQTIRYLSHALDPSWYRPSANDNDTAAR